MRVWVDESVRNAPNCTIPISSSLWRDSRGASIRPNLPCPTRRAPNGPSRAIRDGADRQRGSTQTPGLPTRSHTRKALSHASA
eukprot:6081165-Pleurochrysis_carterae.AAC.3